MPKTVIRAGVELDIPDRHEISSIVGQEMRQFYQLRGLKWMRLPILQGTPASSALTLGEGLHVGPQSGYAWSLLRIVVDGLTSGATPDVMNMYRNSTTGTAPLWQFNGNNFGYTFGRLEMTLMSGDELMFANVGSLAATGLVRVSGELVEMPSEKLAELAV
jgi:hypothetical protein